MKRPNAYTLLELIIVICIIICMVGMAFPIVQMTQRQAMRTNSLSILGRTDSALRRFKQEFGVYPYQATYPNLAAGETFTDHPNQLYHALGTVLTGTDRDLVAADMESAAGAFSYNLNAANNNAEGAQPSTATYVQSEFAGNVAYAVVANRIAAQRARMAVLSGNLRQHGPRIIDATGTVVADRTGTTLLANPVSAGIPGWTSDYLAGELPAGNIRGQTILDAYHHPLIYINQTLPGIRGTMMYVLGNNVLPADTRLWGLGTEGFELTTGPTASILAAGRGVLLESGRIPISATNAGDGLPTPTDPNFFPDPATPLHSDVRYYCGAGFEGEFELWSAGPDGRFDYMRDGSDNSDNISLLPYNRDLHP